MEASNSTGGAYQADAHGRPLLRPLLPALSPDPAHDTPMLKGMIRRTGVPARAACHACRRRKSRCSGGRPRCASCQARNVDCVYDTASKGETRVQALKRKCVELNEKDSSHRKVYELLATLPLPEARALFDRLRQTDGADTLLRLFNDGDLLLQLKLTPESRSRYEFPYRREMPATVMEFDNPYLNSLVYECSLRNSGTHDSLETIDVAFEAYRDMYLKPFHAATVVDPLLDAVEPSKWTNVSKDDALMRRILAAYFMNEYQSLPAFHKDYFLKDMAEGRHRFCSRLLVNTVLAMGCICFNALPKRYEHWNPQNLVYQFMNEAKRLWELEAHKLKLTTIQAGPILNVIHNMCCQDKLGWAYTMQSVTMAHNFGLFSPASRSPSSRQYTKREQDARDFTAWCIFTFQTLHCLLLFDAPLMFKPPDIPLPDPTTDADWYSEVWFKYPTRDRLCPASFGQLFRARAAIRVITNDILLACYGDHTPTRHLSIEQASMFNYRLEAWYNALPRVLNAKKSVLPSHLLLHINYQNLLINIHGPFLQAGPFADGYDPYLSREAAMMRLETLLRLYYLRHGFEVADAFVIQPLSLMAFENMQKLQANPYGPRSDAIRSSLILAAKGLWDQGQSCYVSRTTLCLLRKRLLQQGPSELQAEAELQTLDKESNITIEPDAAHHMQIREVRSRWPPSMHSITEDPEGQRLSALVERYMSIEGNSDSEDEGDRDDEFMDDDNGYSSTHERAAVQAGLSSRSPGTMTTNTSTTQVDSPS